MHNDEITGEVSNLFFFKTYNNKKVQPFLIGLFLKSVFAYGYVGDYLIISFIAVISARRSSPTISIPW